MSSVYLISCSSQKNTVVNRKLQNLSAKYNLIFNADVILNDYLEGVNESEIKDFTSILPLYFVPEQADVKNAGKKIKELDEIDEKARVVMAEKGLSNYLDEAQMLMGKTNFYHGKYYNSNEYFDYVARTYKKNHKIYLDALNWKARSLIALKDYKIASKILDTIKRELDSVKRNKSEALATLSQFEIIKGNNLTAIDYLNKALKAGSQKTDKLNWTYTLAQLYEIEKDYNNSLINYTKIVKSNAAFDLYFNAKLSSVRINEMLDATHYDKKAQLMKMLKDDKNADFVDQIYYEMAEDLASQNKYEEAEKFYNKSIRNGVKNNTQKAFSYLKLANLSIQQYNDYVGGKLYYDSAVMSLPKNHPLYTTTSTKAKNLTYLQKRHEIITLEDSLQQYSKLTQTDRLPALQRYFEERQPVANQRNSEDEEGGSNTNFIRPGRSRSTFYFNNPDAISRGYNEFLKKWGNRKWGVNWRNSTKNIKEENTTSPNMNALNLGAADPDAVSTEEPSINDKANRYLDSIPLTPAQLEKSNQRIITAYLEMGSFYQQVLKDNQGTIKTYQTLLSRFPNIQQLDRVYYSLYLAYKDTDKSKSENYKNLVLNKYPNSVFAKTIIDPNFSVKQNELENTLKTSYEKIFDQLQEKQYKLVIAAVNSINQRFPDNKFSAQFDYLKALAIGHTANIEQLNTAFKEISDKYKNDKLIKPLVNQHLTFINANLSIFKSRKTALLVDDKDETAFSEIRKRGVSSNEAIIANVLDPTWKNKTINYITPVLAKEETKKEVIVSKDEKTISEEKKTIVEQTKSTEETAKSKIDTIAKVRPPAIKEEIKSIIEKPKPIKDELFNNKPSDTYYFVVAVNSLDLSLSSSRFGIGQFNRGNYTGSNLRHQLQELDKAQLILVGDFTNSGEAKTYLERIKSQINSIMKVPSSNYSIFVISKENLSKITDRSTLERYKAYFESNEL